MTEVKEGCSTTTKFERSFYTFSWRIEDFDQICPPGVPSFDTIQSPKFIAGEDIGKKSKWYAMITGIEKNISFYLGLHTAQSGFKPIKCSFDLCFGNADDPSRYIRKCVHTFTKEEDDWGYKAFISLEKLYQKKDDLLQDNTLHICIPMIIFGDLVNLVSPQKSMKRKQSEIDDERAAKRFTADLGHLFHTKALSDVEIKCDKKTFSCHKLILSARSKVFQALFSQEMTESRTNKIIIEDMNSGILAIILKYIYTGVIDIPSFPSPASESLTVNNNKLTEIIYGSEKYDLPELKSYCFSKMLENITEESIPQLAHASHTFNADDKVKQSIKKYCKERIAKLMENPAFREVLVKFPDAFYDD